MPCGAAPHAHKASLICLCKRSTILLLWGWYVLVRTYLMPRLVQAPLHKAEVNWAPLSVVTTAGAPKYTTQLAMKWSVHVLASMLRRGTASTHQVDLSMMVKRYTWLSEEAGSVPTRSMCTWQNLPAGTGMTWRGAAGYCGPSPVGPLALLVVLAHSCQILTNTLQHKACGHHAFGGTYARLGHPVNGMKNNRGVCQWCWWSGNATCHVAQQAAPSTWI